MGNRVVVHGAVWIPCYMTTRNLRAAIRRFAYLVFGQDEQTSFEGVPFRYGTRPLDPKGLDLRDGHRGRGRTRTVLRRRTPRTEAAAGVPGIRDAAPKTGIAMKVLATRQIKISE